ncbi:MAG TPA: hypothetical protein VN213_03805 [Solirubrobacteraceae bacterium]|nr:hypothetical protein [Solirubrobacteraceae bacterium]
MVAAGALVLSMIATGGAVAAAAPAQVERGEVEFVIEPGQCSKLPAGTTVEGSGRNKSVTRTTTDPATGVQTIVNYTRAWGTAEDDDGNRYRFDYRNSFHVVNSAAAPAVFTGTMFDLFALEGRGPARLRNGFVAIFTMAGETATYQPLYAWGDPIDFAAGTARCDPL